MLLGKKSMDIRTTLNIWQRSLWGKCSMFIQLDNLSPARSPEFFGWTNSLTTKIGQSIWTGVCPQKSLETSNEAHPWMADTCPSRDDPFSGASKRQGPTLPRVSSNTQHRPWWLHGSGHLEIAKMVQSKMPPHRTHDDQIGLMVRLVWWSDWFNVMIWYLNWLWLIWFKFI